jgi:BlaI family transcriptional regulator, penicillinase repressor
LLLTYGKNDAKFLAIKGCELLMSLLIGGSGVYNETMAKNSHKHLSRREREIMDIIYERGQATVAEVMERLDSAPSYSAVRALLRILEEKGALRHEKQGQRYIFIPTVTREKAKRSALKRMLQVFFNDSTEAAVAELLDISHTRLTEEEWERLAALVEQAKKRG